MIICPNCNTGLGSTIEPVMHCSVCEFTSGVGQGVPLFARDYEKTFTDHTSEAVQNLIANANRHFWMIARRQIITDTIVRYVGLGRTFLEVGSGPGDISNDLAKRGLSVTVSDIQLEGLLHTKGYGINSVVQFDIYKPIYLNHFDAVGAFDVIEHLDDDMSAVANLLKMVKPGGFVFLTVPAHTWLWNNRDRMESHKRRYSKRRLQDLFTTVEATIVKTHYLFFLILPLLVLRAVHDRLFPKDEFSSLDRVTSMKIHPLVNRILLYITNLENIIFGKHSPPMGGTLLIVTRKN